MVIGVVLESVVRFNNVYGGCAIIVFVVALVAVVRCGSQLGGTESLCEVEAVTWLKSKVGAIQACVECAPRRRGVGGTKDV